MAKRRMARARKRLIEDLRTRRSRHSRDGFCNCDCARFLVHKHLRVLEEIQGDTSFEEEITAAFSKAETLEELYNSFSQSEWRIPESLKKLIETG